MSVPVSAILERKGHEVETVSPDAPLSEAVAGLAEHGVGALVVTAGGDVVGILSERDVVRELARSRDAALDRPVREVMSHEVTTCTPATGATELATLMTERRIRHLPVLDGGSLVGIVSIGDVVKSRIDELATQAETLEQYVTGSAY